MYALPGASVRSGMGRQPTKYWIGRTAADTLRLVLFRERARLASALHSTLWKLSRHRSLSGQRSAQVPSARLDREHLSAAIAGALASARRAGRPTHALLAIDLDGFTRVKACFGSAAAERLLLAISHRVRECLGRGDEMARIGGDEFHVLVACEGNATGAWRLAELILHALTA